MGLFEQFPYTNFHELNLDWLIEQLKTVINSAVLSVNGQTGEVVLYQDANVEFPSINDTSWNIVRSTAGSRLGVAFANGYMYVVSGNALDRVYTQNNPPTFPVSSVNGQTGAVVLYQDAGVRLPNVDDNFMNIRRQIDTAGSPAIVGLEVDKTKASRMNGTQRVQIYDAENQPPYPVSSVNGQTGAVMLAIPFNAPLSSAVWTAALPSEIGQWGMQRDTALGTVKVYYVANNTDNVPEAYIEYKADANSPAVTKKLLTTDDIPSGSGVVSINGQTGVVTLYGNTIDTINGSNVTIYQALLSKANLSDLMITITNDKAAVNVAKGDVVEVVLSTITGISDGIYIAQAAVPANTSFTAANLSNTNITKGMLNYIENQMPKMPTFVIGSNNFTGTIFADGYISASGVYAEIFLPFDTHRINGFVSETIASASLKSAAGEITLTNPTVTVQAIRINGVELKVTLDSTAPSAARGLPLTAILTDFSCVCN